HPNVAVVHEIGEHEGIDFMVMELLVGRTLRDVITQDQLTAERAQRLALGIARGLAEAHARGVIHRDLKPENVMVVADDHPKILDFGLAKLVERSTGMSATGQIVGTPAYMSPEQARGTSVDARSDVFAFGVVLYEMLTG